jgi:four helix bundle protein
MPSFRRFEDIEAWKKARKLARAVYEASSGEPFQRDFALRDQVRRAAISIMANIAEGFGRGSSREFLQFLAMAKGSAQEVVSHLYVAVDQGYLSDEAFAGLSGQAQEVGRIVGGLMEYLRKSELRGSRLRQA